MGDHGAYAVGEIDFGLFLLAVAPHSGLATSCHRVTVSPAAPRAAARPQSGAVRDWPELLPAERHNAALSARRRPLVGLPASQNRDQDACRGKCPSYMSFDAAGGRRSQLMGIGPERSKRGSCPAWPLQFGCYVRPGRSAGKRGKNMAKVIGIDLG